METDVPTWLAEVQAMLDAVPMCLPGTIRTRTVEILGLEHLPRALRVIARLRDTVSPGLTMPSGAPLCVCRSRRAVAAGTERVCWYCELREAMDYDGRE